MTTPGSDAGPGAVRSPLAVPLLLLAFLSAAAVLVSVSTGAASLPFKEVLAALSGRADPTTRTIVMDLRVPRAVLAIVAGGGLGVAGAVFQALLRNPLAEPYVLGVSTGAAVGAVAVIATGVGSQLPGLVPAAAMAGAVLTIGVVLRIASRLGGALDTRVLLLAGVVVGAFLNAVILLFLTYADLESFRSAIFWMMGSLASARWGPTLVVAAYVVPSSVLLISLARPLNLISLGEETAFHLGIRVEPLKRTAYLVASLLVAASVAFCGVIGFVGLIVPHAIRMLWGSDHRLLLPGSFLAGGTFLLLADTLARTVAAPAELPVGVITALIGVPLFVFLLTEEDPVNAFDATDLHFRYRGALAPAIENVSLAVPAGGVFALLGPNGSGKSTLLRILLGVLSPDQGEVRFQGKAVGAWDRREFARQVGVVTQHEEMVFPLTVRELVSMGRYPHLGALRAPGREDAEATERAMRRCEVADLSERAISTLSGGERQRARLARALAQEPRVFVLDEPTAALDMAYEMEIFDLLRRLASEDGATVVLVTHHLNLAARFAGTLLLLRKGQVADVGSPTEVLKQATIEDVFEWPVSVVAHQGPGPDTGAPQIVPLARPSVHRHPSPLLE